MNVITTAIENVLEIVLRYSKLTESERRSLTTAFTTKVYCDTLLMIEGKLISPNTRKEMLDKLMTYQDAEFNELVNVERSETQAKFSKALLTSLDELVRELSMELNEVQRRQLIHELQTFSTDKVK